jgi:hypothetical protein
MARSGRESSKKQLLVAIGGHAFVNWPQAHLRQPEPLPMNDDRGRPVENDLKDGEEVEILAWRPKARQGLAYQVRRLRDGREWWVAALYLRQSAAVPEPAT